MKSLLLLFCCIFSPFLLLSQTDEYTVCDLGGNFVSLGNSINESITISDNPLSNLEVPDCIIEGFGGDLPPDYFFDTYLFNFDDPQQDFFAINLQDANQNPATPEALRAFVFQCDCSQPTELKPCVQTCIEISDESGELLIKEPELGFYYILLAGKLDYNYTIKISPEGPCDKIQNSSPIQPNSIVSDKVGEISVFKGGDEAYNSCYIGERLYSGGEHLYQFSLNEQSIVDFNLSANESMGMFLYNSNCGQDCLFAQEMTDAQKGGEVCMDQLPLGPGLYYLVIDKNTAGGDGSFELSINSVFDNSYMAYNTLPITDYSTNEDCHKIKICDLKTTDICGNGTPLPPNSTIAFCVQDGAMQYPVFQGIWIPPLIQIQVYGDQPGCAYPKCGYNPGDEFLIKIQKPSQLASYSVIGKYEKSPFYGEESTFVPKGRSKISDFRLSPSIAPISLTTNVYFNCVPSSQNEFSFDVASNTSWEIRGTEKEWFSVEPTKGFGSGMVNVSVAAFEGTNLRADTFFIVSEEGLQKRFILNQKGKCGYLRTNAGTNQFFCSLDEKIQLAGVSSPSCREEVSFEWTTQDGKIEAGEKTLAPIVAEPGTYTLTALDESTGCKTSSSVTLFPTLPAEGSLKVNTEFIKPENKGAKDGEIEVTISGGSGNYQYSWFQKGELIATSEDLDRVAAGEYLLRVTDLSTCKTTETSILTIITGIEEPEWAEGVLLFPNPANKQLTIQLKKQDREKVGLQLYNQVGSAVLSIPEKRYGDFISLDVTSLPTGIYFLKIAVADDFITRKILLEHL